MMMGLVVLSDEGISAILLYFVIYMFMNLGAFYVVMLMANKTGSEDIEDYRGLGSRAPFLMVALAIFLVSLTGLPPTAGFIGKLYLFVALLNDGWVWLAMVGALNSVIALYYYIRVLRNVFLRDGRAECGTAGARQPRGGDRDRAPGADAPPRTLLHSAGAAGAGLHKDARYAVTTLCPLQADTT